MAALRAVDSWATVGVRTWVSIVYSAIFASGVAYTIWYAAVRQIGSARTSVYSNVIPLVAMATAVLFLGEPFGVAHATGAAAVLAGVAMTRTAPQVEVTQEAVRAVTTAMLRSNSPVSVKHNHYVESGIRAQR